MTPGGLQPRARDVSENCPLRASNFARGDRHHSTGDATNDATRIRRSTLPVALYVPNFICYVRTALAG
eukprot:30711-Eustigmatos_ZCMA.PRE.1